MLGLHWHPRGRDALHFACAAAAGLATGCTTAHYDAQQAQHPSVTVPHRFAEGKNPDEQARIDQEAKAKAQSAESESQRTAPTSAPGFRPESAPDPSPIAAAVYWRYVFVHRAGGVFVESATRQDFSRPTVTPRKLGRYSVELWIGRELLDRVRFDFPLLAGETPRVGPARPIDEETRFGPGADVKQTVLVPFANRARRAELVDRATGERRSLPWPPDAPVEPIAPE